MKKSTTFWLLGCGSGCALLALGVAALIAGGSHLVRSTTAPFNDAIEARKALEQQFGEAADFTPWPDGAVPPERMEAFLTVREATQPAREKLVATLSSLPTDEEDAQELESKPFMERMWAVFDITRSGIGLGAEMGEMFAARNQGLLDAGMGLGEYSYIYFLAYYRQLGHSPSETGEGLPMPNIASRRLTGELRSMLSRQLATLDAGDEHWRARLAEEIESLESDVSRLPWEDGLPEAITASIEPYRERLEAYYIAAANPFELSRNQRKGRWSIQAD